jgi:hypothetical protein
MLKNTPGLGGSFDALLSPGWRQNGVLQKPSSKFGDFFGAGKPICVARITVDTDARDFKASSNSPLLNVAV